MNRPRRFEVERLEARCLLSAAAMVQPFELERPEFEVREVQPPAEKDREPDIAAQPFFDLKLVEKVSLDGHTQQPVGSMTVLPIKAPEGISSGSLASLDGEKARLPPLAKVPLGLIQVPFDHVIHPVELPSIVIDHEPRARPVGESPRVEDPTPSPSPMLLMDAARPVMVMTDAKRCEVAVGADKPRAAEAMVLPSNLSVTATPEEVRHSSATSNVDSSETTLTAVQDWGLDSAQAESLPAPPVIDADDVTACGGALVAREISERSAEKYWAAGALMASALSLLRLRRIQSRHAAVMSTRVSRFWSTIQSVLGNRKTTVAPAPVTTERAGWIRLESSKNTRV